MDVAGKDTAPAGTEEPVVGGQSSPAGLVVGTAVSHGAGLSNEGRRVIQEFEYLLEKSQQLFHGLRELPQFGYRQWHAHFAKTFEVYTRLWKYQQQHRSVLDAEYGLRRWEIGEVASKIGQLYYHYYLRTSETSYLQESFIFYDAIRARQYFSKIIEERRPELMIKRLRYYARFIVVCLLLRKELVVRDLIGELKRHVDAYIRTFRPTDGAEWQLVQKEILQFLEADNLITVTAGSGGRVVLSHRLKHEDAAAVGPAPSAKKAARDREGASTDEPAAELPKLKLQECILVGTAHHQAGLPCVMRVKFSELTLDMYRMLQALEREVEPSLDAVSMDAKSTMDIAGLGRGAMSQQGLEKAGEADKARANPHKYLLYRPTFSQLLTFVATAFKEMSVTSVMLLYLSADGMKPPAAFEGIYSLGGVATSRSKRPQLEEGAVVREDNCLHAEDLLMFTRKPLFVIVDSNNSTAFQKFPNLFGQPLVALLSPTEVPSDIDQLKHGNLFSLFLHAPLVAFCLCVGISMVQKATWKKAEVQMRKIYQETARLLRSVRGVDSSFLRFLDDDFLRQFLCRFVFACCFMNLHAKFRQKPEFMPSSFPSMPTEVTGSRWLEDLVFELSSLFDVRNQLSKPDASEMY